MSANGGLHNGIASQSSLNVGKAISKRPILALPLVPRTSRLTERLLPDPITPTPSALVSVSNSAPSLLRRSRNVGEGAHFTYVTPFVLEFPYDLKRIGKEHQQGQDVEPEEDSESEKARIQSMSQEERTEYGMQRARKEMERVEGLLRPYEVDPESIKDQHEEGLTGYLPPGRASASYPSARLLGISHECIDDCVAQLDVGDAETWIASHSGKNGPDCYSSGNMAQAPQTQAEQARVQLSDYLSGRLIGVQLPRIEDAEEAECENGAERGVASAQEKRIEERRREDGEIEQESTADRWQRRSELLRNRQANDKRAYSGYAPWANAYSGHQFGQWAGQLGDGRAITLIETQDAQTGQRWEMQLKGAGRTSYSRFADGLAALFSSVREYLASEAMHGLRTPTSRALALVAVPDVNVQRERSNPAAICSRLAPIWTRVGSFEHHATRHEWESVRLLGEFVCREGYGWKDVAEAGSDKQEPPVWAERLIRECAQRNAEMVAKWQAYGFMHGVMNTDNISLLGITIDYGPYGFMDIFDRYTICNKSDGEGRYAYHMQPTAAMFVMEQLTKSLAAVVGFERKNGRAARPGELVAMDKDELNALGQQTHDKLWPQVKEMFMDTLISAWLQAWRERLALQTANDVHDRTQLVDPLLDILDGYLDFTQSMRSFANNIGKVLAQPESVQNEHIDKFVEQWLDWDRVPSSVRDQRQSDAKKWTQTYIARVRSDRFASSSSSSSSEGAVDVAEACRSLEADLKARNPSFTLRNWVTDEVVKRLHESYDTDFLARILHMSLHPFDPWGEPETGKSDEQLAEEKRLCAVGTLLTTNMPSCSS